MSYLKNKKEREKCYSPILVCLNLESTQKNYEKTNKQNSDVSCGIKRKTLKSNFLKGIIERMLRVRERERVTEKQGLIQK